MRTDVTAINAKSISVNGTPIAGSPAAFGQWTTFDQLDADVVLALNGVVIQGTIPPGGVVFTNYENVNVLSGAGLANSVIYGSLSSPVSNASTGPIGIGTGGTPTPTPSPVFSVQPSISPNGGVAGTTFTASDGTASNTAGYTRRWLLNTSSIGTGTTVVSAAGSLILEVTATGPGGSTIATSPAATVTSTPTPTPTPTPVAQPSNWALSWHEMHPLLVSDAITFGGSDGTGNFVAMQVDRPSGVFFKKTTFTPQTSTQDDHNASSPFRTAAGTLLIGMCGHTDKYVGGASTDIKSELRVARATSGNFDDLPVDRSAMVQMRASAATLSNYIQFYQNAAGKILLLWNADNANNWRFYTSDDDGVTWTLCRPLVALGTGWPGVAQLYIRMEESNIFTGTLPGSGVSGTFMTIYGWIHPAVGSPRARLFSFHLKLDTGVCYSSGTGGEALLSSASAYSVSTTAIVTVNAATSVSNTTVREPAATRTQRVFYVHNSIAYLADMVNASETVPYSDGQHIVSKIVGGTRTDYLVGPCGVPFWQTYMPDMQPAREPHSGNRLYRCVNDGTAYNSGSKLLRVDYPTGIENGGAVVTPILEAGVTSGIDANDAILRYFPVRGAQATGTVGFAWVVDTYADFTNWTGGRFVPVVI